MLDDVLYYLAKFLLIAFSIYLGYAVGDSVQIIYEIKNSFLIYALMISVALSSCVLLVYLYDHCFEDDQNDD